jgi:acetoin utilization protein AcuA
MHAFTRTAEREAALLRRIAARPENNLVIAHTPVGEIVGEVTLVPAEGRFFGLDSLYEAAIEVAPAWRGAGLAEELLRFAFEPEYVERLIIIARGLSWHWDLAGTGLSRDEYRRALIRLFATVGFQEYFTDDEEVLAAGGNLLLARIGRHVPHEVFDAFYTRLSRVSDWRGF